MLLRVCIFAAATALWTASATRAWEVPLEYAIDQSNYAPLGRIELTSQYDGNYTGKFYAHQSASAASMIAKLHATPTAYYRVRSGDIFSSNLACLMVQARLEHEFALTLDSVRQKIVSLTVYPRGIYDAGVAECAPSAASALKPTGLIGTVVVTNIGELPSPDVVSYLAKVEEEKRTRQHGASQDNRSFIGKYWMYIVPIVIIMMFTSAMNNEQAQE